MKSLNLFSISIILLVSFLTGNVSAKLFDVIVSYKHNNLEKITYFAHRCPMVASAAQKQNKVILRIDDIQANAWRDVSEKMVLDAREKGMVVVLGVIPYKLLEDNQLFDFLRENGCSTEVALHGWQHSVNGDYNQPEFGNLTKKEAARKISEGVGILQKITKSEITTFIPPQNQLSRGARMAIKAEGFRIISSEGEEKYDYSTTTFDWRKKELVPVEEIMEKCETHFAQDKPCIIMLHPQDYATNEKLDQEKYGEYLRLLNELEKGDIATITFQQL